MNLNKIVEERTAEPLEQNSHDISQEQLTRSMSDILFQRMNQSEVELMKAENLQLKQTLADFTNNYNKFEDMINSTIQQNNANVMRNLNEQNVKLEQKLSELKKSNEVLSGEISATIEDLHDRLAKIVDDTSSELSKSVLKTSKRLEGSVNTIEDQMKSFWSFSTFQTCLFWSAMLSIIVLLAKPMCEVYQWDVPVLFWKIIYPVASAPVLLFLTGSVIKTIIEKVRGY